MSLNVNLENNKKKIVNVMLFIDFKNWKAFGKILQNVLILVPMVTFLNKFKKCKDWKLCVCKDFLRS